MFYLVAFGIFVVVCWTWHLGTDDTNDFKQGIEDFHNKIKDIYK